MSKLEEGQNNPPLHHWIDRYDHLISERRYLWLHAIASCFMIVGTLALFWALPVPEALTRLSPLLNWSTALLLALIVYYFILSLPLALALLPVIAMLAVGVGGLSTLTSHLPLVSAALLVMAISLDLASMRNKTFGSLVEFLQLAMLAPFWLFHHAVQRKPA